MEFAIVAPVMFLVIFACIEFTRFVMVSSLAEDAAYEAARHVIVPGAVASEAQDVSTRIMAAMGVTPDRTDVKAYNNGTLQLDIDEDTTEVQVHVRIRVSDISLLLPKFFTGNTMIVRSARLNAERYVGYYDGSGP